MKREDKVFNISYTYYWGGIRTEMARISKEAQPLPNLEK